MADEALQRLLLADLAVEMNLLSPGDAAEALGRGAVLETLGAPERERVERAAATMLEGVDGDALRVLRKRRVHPTLQESLPPTVSRALAATPSSLGRPELSGQRYAGFRLLGEGGMGVVYIAVDTSLNRQVALKMIREGTTDPLDATPRTTPSELETRFLQEAAVTGGLEHPGIVPVYELGQTPSGAPYYTMRLIRGDRTLEDAISEAGDLESRLGVLEPFLKVCDAIRYAHSRGVVHRDLKPANVALGNFGEVVVLDWGLAKVGDRPDLTEAAWQKRIRELRETNDLETLTSAIGTPGYMSPEASLGEIEKVDARSDVFSLGAILYRILTGKPPFPFPDLTTFMEKLMQGVDEVPGAPEGLAAICLRALAVDRDKRPADAGELGDAIRAWQRESAIERELHALHRDAASALQAAESLEGEPLLRQLDRVVALAARIRDVRADDPEADAFDERARAMRSEAIARRERDARRRLLGRVGIVGLCAAAAATVLVALMLDARRREAEDARARERIARGRAEAERARAETERTRAEGLAGFMLFDLRDALQPIGRLDLLESVARRSLEYYESLPEEGTTDATRRARGAALSNVAAVLRATGDVKGMLASTRSALRVHQDLAARDPTNVAWQLDVAMAYRDLAVALRATGDSKGALDALEASVAIARRLRTLHPESASIRGDLAAALVELATVHFSRGDRSAALEECRESVLLRRDLAKGDPQDGEKQRALAWSLNLYGDLLASSGDARGAREAHAESLAVCRRDAQLHPADADAQDALATALARAGKILQATGDLRGALEHHRESLKIRRGLAARDPTNAEWQGGVAEALDAVGGIEERTGDLMSGLGSYRSAVEIRRRIAEQFPANSWASSRFADSLDRLAKARMASGDRAGALETHRSALVIRERLTAQDPDNAGWQRERSVTLARIGSVLVEMGNLADATASFEASLAIRRRLADRDPSNGGDPQLDLAMAHDRVGLAREAAGDLAGALTSLREAHAIKLRLAASDPVNTDWQRAAVVSWNRIGVVQQAMGDTAAAKESFGNSLDIAKRLAEKDPANAEWAADIGSALLHLAGVQELGGDLPGALASLDAAREGVERLMLADPANAQWQANVVILLRRAGDVQAKMGRAEAALASYRSSLEIAERLARKDPANAAWQSSLVESHACVGDALLAANDAKGALAHHRAALAIVQKLRAQDPSNTGRLRDEVMAHKDVGEALRKLKDIPGALASYETSLELARLMVERDPANAIWQRDLSVSLDRVADLHNAGGDRDAALKLYRESAAIRRRLAEEDPANADALRGVAVSMNKIADVLRRQGDVPGSIEAFRESVAIYEKVNALDPTNAVWQRGHSIALLRLASTLTARGDYDEALQRGRAALQVHAGAVKLAKAYAGEHAGFEKTLRRIGLLAGTIEPDGASDQLQMGYLLRSSKDYRRAAKHLEAALADPEVRADLVNGHLYNAACAAALASTLGGADAGTWRDKALQWLGEDAELRREEIRKLDLKLGTAPSARLEAERRRHVDHLARALSEDADLAALRDLPAFRAIYEPADR